MSEAQLAEELGRRATGARQIVAIAGPPASGKSTLAAQVADAVGPTAAVLGMDGFHYDDAILKARGLMSRKGAPDTFDTDGLAAMLDRLRKGGEVAVPVFDRNLELSRAGAEVIGKDVQLVLVEGNYLLLDRAPWKDLVFDVTVFLEVPEARLRSRLMDRWSHLSMSEAMRKTDENDLPNARLVMKQSRAADITL